MLHPANGSMLSGLGLHFRGGLYETVASAAGRDLGGFRRCSWEHRRRRPPLPRSAWLSSSVTTPIKISALTKALKNAVGDARIVRDTLRNLGFEVSTKRDLDRRALVDRLFDLAARIGRGRHCVLLLRRAWRFLQRRQLPAPVRTSHAACDRARRGGPAGRTGDRRKRGDRADDRCGRARHDHCARRLSRQSAAGRRPSFGRGHPRARAKPVRTRRVLHLFGGAWAGSVGSPRPRRPPSESLFTRRFIRSSKTRVWI